MKSVFIKFIELVLCGLIILIAIYNLIPTTKVEVPAKQSKTDFVSPLIIGYEIIKKDTSSTVVVENEIIEEVITCPYSTDELEALAHLIGGEAGADWCSEKMRYYVGSVVLNRVKSGNYPDTILGVITDSGQYQCYINGSYYDEPSEACYEIAEDLLVNGSILPDNVVYQAEFTQGSGVYTIEQNMYFCYQ